MLSDHPVFPILLSTDLDATRTFYSDTLGLEILREDKNDRIVFRCGGGTQLAVTLSTVRARAIPRHRWPRRPGFAVRDRRSPLPRRPHRGVQAPIRSRTTASPTWATPRRHGSSTRAGTSSPWFSPRAKHGILKRSRQLWRLSWVATNDGRTPSGPLEDPGVLLAGSDHPVAAVERLRERRIRVGDALVIDVQAALRHQSPRLAVGGRGAARDSCRCRRPRGLTASVTRVARPPPPRTPAAPSCTSPHRRSTPPAARPTRRLRPVRARRDVARQRPLRLARLRPGRQRGLEPLDLARAGAR